MSQPNLLQILLIYEAVNTSIGPLIQAGVLMLGQSTKLVSYWWIPVHTMCYSCSTAACSPWWNHHVDCQQMLENSLCLRRAENTPDEAEVRVTPGSPSEPHPLPGTMSLRSKTSNPHQSSIWSWSQVPSNPPGRSRQQRLFLLNLWTRGPKRLQFVQSFMCQMHEYSPNALKDTVTLRSRCSAHWSLQRRRFTPSDVIGRHVGASRSKLTFSLTLVSSKTFKIVT